MNQRLRDAFQALRDARDDATTKITYYTGEGRAGVWLPSRQEDIDSFSSTAAELRNKIDAWQALGIDEHTLKPCPHRDVELLDRAFDAISATEAILKDLEALHADLLKFAQLLRARLESMRPEERIYWAEAEPHDDFQAGKFFQDRPSNYVRSIYATSFYDQAMAKLEENPETMNSEIWELTDFAQVVSMGIEWNADPLPAGCFAWAFDEIAGAEISEGANGSPEKNDPEYERRNRSLEPNKKTASNRGRPTKERRTENRAKFIGLISATPALLDQYQVVAGFIGVSESTIRRWADELRSKNKSRK